MPRRRRSLLSLLAFLPALACAGKSVRNEDGGEPGDAGEPPTASGGRSGTGGAGTGAGGASAGARGGSGAMEAGGSQSRGGASGTATGGGSGTTTGGMSGSAGSSGTGTCLECTPTQCTTVTPPTSMLNDFDNLYFADDTNPPLGIFGILDAAGMMKPEWWLGYFSGSYNYPIVPEACTGEPTPPYPLARDETGGALHVTGTVGGPSGFGVWLGPCIVDLSAYAGISFTIGGQTGSGRLEFKVYTSSNMDPDRCLLGRGTCTQDVCTPAGVTFPVPASPTVITLPWSALSGGAPEPSVDPAEVVQLNWDFVWLSGMTPYDVDVTLDRVMLVVGE